MTSISFELFLQEDRPYYEDSDALRSQKEDLKIEFPAYRHYLFIPQRTAVNFVESDHDSDGDDISNVDDSNEEKDDPYFCGINENGEVNADPLADQIFLYYKYKVVTNETAVLEEEVLPFLEKNLLEKMMVNLFQCNEERGRGLSENLPDRIRRLGLVGASSNPKDILSTTESCSAESDMQSCQIVDGVMTLYTDGRGGNDLEGMSLFLCDSLNSSEMAMTHEAIMELECIPTNPIGPAPIDPGEELETNVPAIQQASQDYATPMTIVSVMIAVLIFAGVFVYRRASRRPGEGEEVLPVHNTNSQQELDYAMTCLHDSESISGSGSMSSGDPVVSPIPLNIITKKSFVDEYAQDENSLDGLPFPVDPLCMCVVDSNH